MKGKVSDQDDCFSFSFLLILTMKIAHENFSTIQKKLFSCNRTREKVATIENID